MQDYSRFVVTHSGSAEEINYCVFKGEGTLCAIHAYMILSPTLSPSPPTPNLYIYFMLLKYEKQHYIPDSKYLL